MTTLAPRNSLKNYEKVYKFYIKIEKLQKMMIFEELRIFGRQNQILCEKLPHLDQLSAWYDPKIVKLPKYSTP